ncbi:MAG: type II toxin-antitoxin system VapC family toxin [Planctomycetes bacterium]|nr:type II toxin-antitoxin system VapC family toxin [Planctomycetota bacterium]
MSKKDDVSKSEAFVLDGSVAVAWFFEDEADAYAEAIENSLLAASAVVPSLWRLEVANALLVGERRKRTTEAKVTAMLALLESLPITIDDETGARAWRESLHLARVHDLSVYDAAYLELALRRSLPIATMDAMLKSGAVAAGVPLYAPG